MRNVIEGCYAAQVQQASAKSIPIPLHMHSTAGESPATCISSSRVLFGCIRNLLRDHVLLQSCTFEPCIPMYILHARSWADVVRCVLCSLP